jgi:hypothetical protein
MIRIGVGGADLGEDVASENTRDLRAALREADWEGLLPRLVSYAERRLRRLGWTVGWDEEPSAVSVEQVINDAIERCLEGSRTWNVDAPPELGAFLCGVIKSITSTERKKEVRSKLDLIEDGAASARDPALTVDELLQQEEGRAAICASIELCVEGDDKLELLYLAILDGTVKREEIATALGWTLNDVSAARIKLQRRLVAKFPEQFASHKKARVSS